MLVQKGESIVRLAQYVDVLTVHLWDLSSSPVGYCGLGL